MEKLTQKQFIELLKSHETSMVVNIRRKLTETEEGRIYGLTWKNAKHKFNLTLRPRKVVKVGSTSIEFSNSSFLSFRLVHDFNVQYYRVGDTVFIEETSKDNETTEKQTLVIGYLMHV